MKHEFHVSPVVPSISNLGKRRRECATRGTTKPIVELEPTRVLHSIIRKVRKWHITTNPKAQNLGSVLMQSRHLWKAVSAEPVANDPLADISCPLQLSNPKR